jgi:hypothetical protein
LQANANLAFNIAIVATHVTWFSNTSTNNHMTPDLVSMMGLKPYLDNDQLYVGDGKALKCTFIFSNILYVPHIKKPLLSVQKFCLENNVFFEFHPFVFYVKKLITDDVLIFYGSKNGLYVIYESSVISFS